MKNEARQFILFTKDMIIASILFLIFLFGTIYLENEDILKTIKRADDAVYKAKELGRNKVVIF